ncbi:MAG: hypothetical protein F6K08_00185 [Okeania sp. SIO1H6]|nr:hypothetical protein [Okeania sp. SIO1H6]
MRNICGIIDGKKRSDRLLGISYLTIALVACSAINNEQLIINNYPF